MIYQPNSFDFWDDKGCRWRMGSLGLLMLSPAIVWVLSQRWICAYVPIDRPFIVGEFVCDERTRTVAQWLLDGVIYFFREQLPGVLVLVLVSAWLIIGGALLLMGLLGDGK